MFSDPKKELQELEDQLLAAEQETSENDEEFQRIYAEVLAEFGPVVSHADEPPIRNFANGYGRDFHKPIQQPVEQILPEPPAPREHFGFLTFLFCLECLLFAGVAISWLVNMR